MHTPKISLLSHLFLVTTLLAGLFFNGPAAAARPITQNDSPGKPASAGLHPAAKSASLLTIPAVPVGTSSPKVNGACSQAEYSGGLFIDFTDGPGGNGIGSVYLVHDANFLFMCITSPMGSNPARFDALYLDPQGDGTRLILGFTHADVRPL